MILSALNMLKRVTRTLLMLMFTVLSTTSFGQDPVLTVGCGDTLTTFHHSVNWTAISGHQAAEIELKNLTNGRISTGIRTNVNTGAPLAYFSGLDSLERNTNYRVRIRVKANDVWGNFGDSCTVRIGDMFPVLTDLCGDTIDNAYRNVNWSNYGGQDTVEMKFTNLNSGEVTYGKKGTSNTNTILAYLHAPDYNSTYSVAVRVKLYDFWTAFGDSCVFDMGEMPEATIINMCDSVIPNSNVTIQWSGLPGQDTVGLKFVDIDSGQIFEGAKGTPNYSTILGYFGMNLPQDRHYNAQVKLQVNGVWGDYGPACPIFVGEPFGLRDGYCDTIYTSTSSNVGWTYPLAGQQEVELNFTNTTAQDPDYGLVTTGSYVGSNGGVPLQTFMTPTNGDLKFGRSYSVQGRAKVNGSWTALGNICHVQVDDPPMSLRPEYCDTTYTSVESNLGWTYPISGQQAVELQFTNVTSGHPDEGQVTVGSVTGNYAGKDLSEFMTPTNGDVKFGRSYSVKVKVQVNDTWTAYGDSCTIHVADQQVALRPEYCDTTYTSVESNLGWTYPISGQQAVELQFTNVTSGHPDEGQVTVGSVPGNYAGKDLSEFMTPANGDVKFGRSYSVKVKVQVNDTWTAYGDPCTIHVAPPPVSLTNGGDTLYSLTESLHWNYVAGQDSVDVEFTDQITSDVTYGYHARTNNNCPVHYLTQTGEAELTLMRAYQVRVRIRVNGLWSAYGDTATIYVGSPKVSLTNGGDTLYSLTEKLHWNYVAGQDSVDVEFTDQTTGQVSYGYHARTNDDCPVHYLTQTGEAELTLMRAYQVRVRIRVNGLWTAYGDPATIYVGDPKPSILTCDTTYATFAEKIKWTEVQGQDSVELELTNQATQEVMKASIGTYMTNVPMYYFSNTAQINLDINAHYTARVRINVNGTWSSYGDTCTIHTAGFPIDITSCNDTFLTFKEQLAWTTISGMDSVQVEFTDSATAQVSYGYNAGANSNRPMYYLTNSGADLHLNSTYYVRAQAKVNDTWAGYGETCKIYAGSPIPEVFTCGVNYETFSQTFSFTAVTGQDSVWAEFKDLSDNAITTAKIATAGSSFPMYYLSPPSLANLQVGKTYEVRLRLNVFGDWTEFGEACVITTYNESYASLEPSSQGQHFDNYADTLDWTDVPGATSYQLQFTNNNSGEVSIANSPYGSSYHALTYLATSGGAALTPNSSFTVRINAYVEGAYVGWGPAGQITTGQTLTQLDSISCGKTFTNYSENITYDLVAAGQSYKLKFTNTTAGDADLGRVDEKVYNYADNGYYLGWFNEEQGIVKPNSTYDVRVATLIAGQYTDYGTACPIQTPDQRTKIDSVSCGHHYGSFDDELTYDLLPNASAYRLKFKDITPGGLYEGQEYEKDYNYGDNGYKIGFFVQGGDNIVSPNSTYQVWVAGKYGGAYTNYGDSCVITTGDPTTTIDTTLVEHIFTGVSGAMPWYAQYGAANYRIQFTNVTPGSPDNGTVTSADWNSTNAANGDLGWLGGPTKANLSADQHYEVRVATKWGQTWGGFGDPVLISTGLAFPQYEVAPQTCGTHFEQLTETVVGIVDPIATHYRYQFTDIDSTSLAFGDVTTSGDIDVNYNDTVSYPMGLSKINGSVGPNGRYVVQIQQKVDNAWSELSEGCEITTGDPRPSFVEDSVCGKHFETMTELVHFNSLAVAESFRFQFKNIHPGSVDSSAVNESTPKNTGQASNMTYGISGAGINEFLNPGETYEIRVANKIGPGWTNWSDSCIITTGIPLPETHDTICGKHYADMSEMLGSTVDIPATQFNFRFTDVDPASPWYGQVGESSGKNIGASRDISYSLAGAHATRNSGKVGPNGIYNVQAGQKIGNKWVFDDKTCIITTGDPKSSVFSQFCGQNLNLTDTITWENHLSNESSCIYFEKLGTEMVEGRAYSSHESQATVPFTKFIYQIDDDIESGFAYKAYVVNRYANVKYGSPGPGCLIGVDYDVSNLTMLDAASCTHTFETFDEQLTWTAISGVEDHRFEFTNVTQGHVDSGLVKIVETQSTQSFSNLSWFAQTNTANITVNSDYNVRIAVKLAGVWGGYGPACTIHTGNPVTELLEAYRDSTYADFTESIAWTPLQGTYEYAFRFIDVTPGGAQDTVDAFNFGSTVTSHELSWFALPTKGNLSANHSYQVHVAAKIGSDFTPFGPGHVIHISNPTTSLTTASCNATFDDFSQVMAWDPMPGVYEYGFQFIDVTTPPDGPEDTASFFNYGSTSASHALSWFANVAKGNLSANHSYDVRISGSFGGEFSDFGPACTIHIGDPTTELITAQQGIEFDDFDQYLTWNVLAGAQEYAMRFIEQETGDTTWVMNYGSTTASTKLGWWANRRELSAATTYQVEFAALFGSEFGSWGAPQTFTTGDPTVQLDPAFCEANVELSDVVTWPAMYGRYDQRFEFKNLHTGDVFVKEYGTTIATGALSALGGTQLLNDQSYEVRISVMFGHKWGAWGLPCRLDIGNPPAIVNGPFYTLKRKLDGSLYPVSEDDKLRFIYKEYYHELDNLLDYKVFAIDGQGHDQPEAINEVLNVERGMNYLVLDVNSLTDGQVYLLEVTSQKNEKSYLRFKK